MESSYNVVGALSVASDIVKYRIAIGITTINMRTKINIKIDLKNLFIVYLHFFIIPFLGNFV